MRKSAFMVNLLGLVASLIGATLILALAPSPNAWADDEKSAVTSSIEEMVEESGLNPDPKSDSDDKRRELEEKYGKEGHLSVPPLVVRPLGNTGNSAAVIFVNPTKNTPIDISKARFTKMTPAERFIQFSQIGLLVMGLGAIGLILVAVSRAIRRK